MKRQYSAASIVEVVLYTNDWWRILFSTNGQPVLCPVCQNNLVMYNIGNTTSKIYEKRQFLSLFLSKTNSAVSCHNPHCLFEEAWTEKKGILYQTSANQIWNENHFFSILLITFLWPKVWDLFCFTNLWFAVSMTS